MKILNRRLHVVVILLAFAAVLMVSTVVVMGRLTAQAAEEDSNTEVKEAHIVVQFDESDAIIRPITFTEEITGFRALQLAGLEIEYITDWGPPFVCSIEGIGCPADDCFCSPDYSWGYWYWNGSDWASQPAGAGTTLITQTGAIEGWQWGKWLEEPKPASATEVQGALDALDWLQDRQSDVDGSYGKASPSLDVMFSVGANHVSAKAWRTSPDSPSLQDFIAVAGRDYSQDGASESGRLAAAVAAADGCWPPGASKPSSYYSPTLGSLSDQAGFLSWAILGTIAMSEPIPVDSVNYLRGMAQPAGGWEWSPSWGADTNATAIAIQALVAGRVPTSTAEIVNGLAYLKAAQNDDGGFPYQPDSPYGVDSDSNSTAWIVQAILATGADPRSAEWSKGGFSPIDFLMSMQLVDGSFEYLKGNGADEFATRQVIQALLGNSHPMQIRDQTDCELKAGLKIGKYASNSTVSAVEEITYTLVITSAGANGAQDVLITDTLPNSVGFNGSVTAPSGVTQPDPGVPVWSASALYPGTHKIVYSATVDAWSSGLLTNRVELTSTTPLVSHDVLTASHMLSVTVATGNIEGQVLDAQANGVQGAIVGLGGQVQAGMIGASAYMTETVTDSDGSYRFDGVPARSYVLSVTLPGETDPTFSKPVTAVEGTTIIVDPIDTSLKSYLPSIYGD